MTSFDRSLPMILNRALDDIMPDYRELFARYDLTEQQWRILRVLWSEMRVTSADLSRRTLLPAPSLVGIIDRLEKKGFVSRVRSVEDRRAVYIVPTAKGRALEDEVTPHVAQIDARLRNTVSPEDWQHMENTLRKIAAAAAAPDLPKASNG
ncbi:MarR family winged helix-turn-helix transcriptional regulator [Pseudahrensia aquimaris]|uniref:MarR family winged helix-turn-helix transcriptional regulator n=1 Tax=Pseudahrensia aquimaris TaxID=744461 RepID=A0ABW3FHI0_9HYPH